MITHVFASVTNPAAGHEAMAVLKRTYIVTVEIDTRKAMNFPEGFKDPRLNLGESGYNWNSYPNWDLNYLGRESDFIESMWGYFSGYFDYDGLHCIIARVRQDE